MITSVPSISAAHCHLPQRAVGGFIVVSDPMEILPELVSGRGTAAAGSGGGVWRV